MCTHRHLWSLTWRSFQADFGMTSPTTSRAAKKPNNGKLMLVRSTRRLTPLKSASLRWGGPLTGLTATLIQRRPIATTMSTSKYLTGDRAGIDDFVDKFDVRAIIERIVKMIQKRLTRC